MKQIEKLYLICEWKYNVIWAKYFVTREIFMKFLRCEDLYLYEMNFIRHLILGHYTSYSFYDNETICDTKYILSYERIYASFDVFVLLFRCWEWNQCTEFFFA